MLSKYALIILIEGRNIIIPLRKLEAIKTSWSGRQLDPKHLDRDLESLIKFTKQYQPYFLPIDHDQREIFLEKINHDFNLSLKTDWPVINKKGHYVPCGDFSIVDRHQWFFDMIYSLTGLAAAERAHAAAEQQSGAGEKT